LGVEWSSSPRGHDADATEKNSKELSAKKLRPETKRVIWQVLDESLQAINFPVLEEARERLSKILREGFSEKDRGPESTLTKILTGEGVSATDLESVFRSVIIIKLASQIEKMPEPTPDELQHILKELKTLPYEFRATMDRC